MSLLMWDESLSVNIKEIDRQHQKLLDIINRLHEAMLKGTSKDVMAEILTEMLGYTKYHFSTEENLMIRYNYSELHTHRQEHEMFIHQTNEFNDNYQKGNALISIDILTFLSSWVKKHIMETDKKYSGFLNNKGV